MRQSDPTKESGELSREAIENPGAHWEEYAAAGWTVEDAIRVAQSSLSVRDREPARIMRDIWLARGYISLALKLEKARP